MQAVCEQVLNIKLIKMFKKLLHWKQNVWKLLSTEVTDEHKILFNKKNFNDNSSRAGAAEATKITEEVHKPLLGL